MTSARIPATAWNWRRTAVVSVVVVAPVLGLGLSEGDDLWEAAENLAALMVCTAALVSAIAGYATWRIRSVRALAWATIGLAALGFQQLVLVAAHIGLPERVVGLRALEGALLAALLAMLAVAVAKRVGQVPDPAATGFSLGAVVAAVQLAGLDPVLEVGQHLQRLVVCVGYVAVIVGLAAALWWGGGRSPRETSMPPWTRQRTAIAIVMIGGAHLARYLSDSVTTDASVIIGYTLGAVLLVSTYLALLIAEVEVAGRSHQNLVDDLSRAVRADQDRRSRLHEIRSTVAGITSASQVLSSTQEISGQRRNQLQDMVAAELGRLERLVTPPGPDMTSVTSGNGHPASEPSAIALDSMIGLIAVSYEARGHQVRWSPSGLRVTAQHDAVAQMLNILLDNVAKHGGAEAEVTVKRHGDYVEVAVHDDGPGLDPSLQTRLFEWGARGPRSSGHGIGLHSARDLALQQRGYLRIIENSRGGATFVLGLPLDHTKNRQPGALDDDSSLQSGPG